jgi:unsaturated rhamnogalacturonyl hydrolase
MMMRLFRLLCFTGVVSAAPVVLLDGFHNNETRAPDHYRWEGTKPGGFSEFGKLLQSAGYELKTLHERVTARGLAEAQVFIIVDPDTPAETDNPQYLVGSEIQAIDEWVQRGGNLVLLGNDKGNAEFEHFNQLAARFGIEFMEKTYPQTTGKAILIAQNHGSIFEQGLTVYLVEVAPLRVETDTGVLLSDHGTPIMALVRKGQGQVFAVGDPWLYNEYIDRYDNRRLGVNLFRLLLRKP